MEEQAKEIVFDSENPYNPTVAGKKVGYGLLKLIFAKLASPVAVMVFNNACTGLQGIGVTLKIDPVILSNALPGLIFTGLVLLHDYLAVKTGKTWL